jgi:ATP-binding cassette subfamily C protein
LKWLGRARAVDCPYGSRFPLSPHAWVTFDEAAEVAACDTETLMEDGDPWVGLRRLHRAALDAVATARARERAVAHARLESASLRDDALVTSSVASLAGLADEDEFDRPATPAVEPVADALLAALRVVGQTMGVEVKAPPFEAEGDPLRLICRASGLRARRVTLARRWWEADGGPMLGASAADGSPVALTPLHGRGYVAIAPTRGVKTAVTARTAASIGPNAWSFVRVLPSHPLRFRDLARFAWPVVRRELRTIVMLGAVCGVLGLLAPYVTALVVDDVIPRADRPQLKLLCGFLVAVGASIALLQAVQGLALVRIKGRLEATLLPAAWDRLLSLPVRFFAGGEAGDLALRATGLARVIEVVSGSTVASLLVASFSLTSVLVLFAVDWRLGLLAAALTAAAPLALAVSFPALWRCQQAITRMQGRISALLLVLLSGVVRLRVAGAERRAFAHWARLYRAQVALAVRFQALSDRLLVLGDAWPLVVAMAVFAAVVGLGPGAVSAGGFVAFNLALATGTAAVVGLGKTLLPLLNAIEQCERFRPILDATPEGSEARGDAVKLAGSIRLSNVSFRYDPDGPLVLDDVSLHVRPGEFVAIVGPSGSGKSTLMRLLLGFETPTEGVVAYDGRELAALDASEVRRQIGVVLQDAQLFPGDVLTNIIGLSTGLTRDDAWAAAELAGLDDDLRVMPMGLYTAVGESGAGLSSGQRQRLILARALAGRPTILLLDEATSALDNRTQAHVSRSLQTRLRGTTRLAIAHRVSSIAEADRIYVLVDGKIVQSGRYSQLEADPGPFQDLVRRQTVN